MLRAILQHLRFPFSILLMPVFFMAVADVGILSHCQFNIISLFVILHLFVYPSSNAFNSLQDQDQGSIGLIRNPLPAIQQLQTITIVFDIIALVLASIISMHCLIGIAVYIIASRLYSYRPIRLKKYPILGFLTVFIFQGYWIFILVQYVAYQVTPSESSIMGLCASCLIGAVYPLSQIYQHQQDREDGVQSLSSVLGYRGTFLFAGSLFIIGSILFTFHSYSLHRDHAVWVFGLFQFPVILFFVWWFIQVWKNEEAANFTNTMRMNILSAVCMNLCFIILYVMK